MPFDGTFRPAARQDGDVYCRECLLDHGTDADPLESPSTPTVGADRVTHDTAALPDELPILGCHCEDHDVLVVIYDEIEDGEQWVVVELDSPDDHCMGLTPAAELQLQSDTGGHDREIGLPESPSWGDDYERVVTLTENNAPRTCYGCGDSAQHYLIGPYKFSCGSCRP